MPSMFKPALEDFAKLVASSQMKQTQRDWSLQMYRSLSELDKACTSPELLERYSYQVQALAELCGKAYTRVFCLPAEAALDTRGALDTAMEQLTAIALQFNRPGLNTKYRTSW